MAVVTLDTDQAVTLRRVNEGAERLRRDIVRMSYWSQTSHVGTALSCTDIVAVLYFGVLRLAPADPGWPDRDRFILSKGHGCAAWYAALAERGFFPVEELATFRRLGSRLQGHPDMRKTPGVEMTAGSLGHGLAAGVGMALGLRLRHRPSRVYVVLGDGEVQEGLVWEAALSAAGFRLDNLVAIVDYNHLQSGGSLDKTMPLEPLAAKWEAFGWHALEVDGHDRGALLAAFDTAATVHGKPTAIVAHTVKGKGVSFMEDDNLWHAKPPTREEAERALRELGSEEVLA
jgi:transketolase